MTEMPALDRARIIEVLERHDVDYLVAGGVGAQLHGATRQTADFDSLPASSTENLERLAAALRELRAFLRVGGLSDGEARRLPTRIDAVALSRLEISTWRTDAGDLDVLMVLRRRDGARVTYEELSPRAAELHVDGIAVWVAALEDIIESKEFADRPRTERPRPRARSTACSATFTTSSSMRARPSAAWASNSSEPRRSRSASAVSCISTESAP